MRNFILKLGNDIPSLNDIDEDSNGCYSNAGKSLEEGYSQRL